MAAPDRADIQAPVDLIDEGERVLSAAGIEPARFESKAILADVLETKPSRVLLRDGPVSAEAMARFRELVGERATRTPLQYVLGTDEFMGLTLTCRPGVFIPRPETELLVDAVLDVLAPRRDALVVADVGCGTGGVAIALAHYMPAATVHAVDISADAVQLTADNARQVGVADRVHVRQGDMLEPLVAAGIAEGLDAIVANLPYVPSGDIRPLDPEIRDHEPLEAINGGPDGLACFRRFIGQISTLPLRDRLIALEVGVRQSGAVEALLRSHLDRSDVHIHRDYAGIERTLLALQRPSAPA
ncbi:MAG: peptide chain release factor N(5)-glutamine methyltransferase [Armatimonadota bacterium]|jgi:release factor glutamine methyltransferase